MNLTKTLFLLLIVLNFTSCLQIGVINFKGQKSNLSAADNIKSFMKENKNPSILLRIPTHVQQTTEGKHHNYLYSAIENELAKADFAVRDRGLFNEVLKSERKESINYGNIKELTNTDLILELTRFEIGVQHTTNRFLDKNAAEQFSKDFEVSKTGAIFEFKLIIVNDNSYGGNYTFYYTPCSEDGVEEECDCKIAYKKLRGNYKVYNKIIVCEEEKKEREGAWDEIDKDQLEAVIRTGVKNMIKELK
jgi:hypothetical protein